MKEKDYWFYAKEPGYGYGWGLPANGKGWVAMGIYVLSLIGWSIRFDPVAYPVLFSVGFVMMTVLFVGLCFAKGQVQQK